ncbi:MAG: exosortase/archaeosortase family protein, partial [Planctomycetes bacterium]|nr:exosortase/archaeosortase family protein [Planctomycetota bacterium]
MEEKPSEKISAQPAKNPNQFIPALIIAATVYLFFDLFANKLIETQLREISSIIGQFILSIFYTDVVRNGTILTVSGLRFDVVGACSGSTTLKVLTGLGIFWVGTYPRLTLERRVFAGILTVPIAIFSNGVRVSMLVAGSVTLGEPIADGPLHALFGLISFSLALACFFILTDRLALDPSHVIKTSGVKKKWVAITILLSLFYLPFLIALVSGWWGARYNPYNHIGALATMTGVGLGVYFWNKAPRQHDCHIIGFGLFFLSLLIALASIMIEVKLLLGISMLGALLSFCLILKGWRFTVSCLPICGIIYLGFPKIEVQLNTITSYFKISAMEHNLLIRSLLLAFLLIVFFILKSKLVLEKEKKPAVFNHLNLILIPTILAVCFQAYFATAPLSGQQNNTLAMSFLLGDWVGKQQQADELSRNFFGADKIWKRRYTNSEGDHVDVIINSSSGDRTRNHPPEYCQTGAGFKFDSSDVRTFLLPNGKELKVTYIEMHYQDNLERKLDFMYWFTDGESAFADYVNMMAHDTMRRLVGQKTDWF